MNVTDINKSLTQLAENKTRENVLDLSFALLQWMKIEPNAGNRPQLLSPQTQKLKDYLATAPQTVQPQLYRLSADNQNIRVRFAVLKKLKKDYISQLVDNDPGLSSYQSFSKGLTSQNGTGFIPAQPYFVHFITTPDYDKLVMVFNQGEQKRIVTFRNRLTNTQYNKIIQQWQGIGVKSKSEIADLLWKSIDIKEVNKEFYKQIKERFDTLIGIVKTQHNKATENQVKQFTVRLIGRYIFCWFLKEKGIIPNSLISKATIESTDNYYQNVLLKLFFETLNTKVQDRNPLTHNKLFEKIPYLNGGLFDESDEDKLFTKLKLDAWLLPFVEILESYDFTIDESSSQYQQVAVDPEMLGRIFENLLASQNEETSALVNKQKTFGVFYTPREIVDYMVNESIRTYLQNKWEQKITTEKSKSLNNPETVGDLFGNKKPQQLALDIKRYELKEEEKTKISKAIESLFTVTPDASHLKKDEKYLLLTYLEEIKIIDPACGSGAFPMGILHKLVEFNEALGTVKSSYELKKDILSHNIYGVDIMPMAIEIARLRAWLSLVLEEEYKPNDPKHNFGLKPLPNLDFKFVCANSLIDIPEDEYVSNMAADYLKEFEKLTEKYFGASLEAKAKLKDDITDCINRITEIHSIAIDRFKLQIKREEKSSAEGRLNKMKLRLDEYERQHHQWQSYKNIFIEKTVEFFNTKYFFPAVKEGFDVVIGNPPYVQMQKNNGHLANQLKDAGYSTYDRTGDVYAIFYELGFKLLSEKGVHTFITSSQWLKANYGRSLRELFLSKNPLKLIALGPGVFESAVVDTNILIAKNENNRNELIGSTVDKPEQLNNLYDLKYHPMPYVSVEKWAIMNGGKQSIDEKIRAKGKSLNKWKLSINRGVLTGYNEAFIIDESKRNDLIRLDPKNEQIIKPILKGREINKFTSNWENDYIVFVPWHFPLHDDESIVGASEKAEKEFSKKYRALYDYLKSHKEGLSQRNQEETEIRYEWYALQRSAATYRDEFAKEKIIWKRIGSQLRFSYSDSEIYCLDSTCIATGEKIKYLTGLLNSKLCNYQLFETAPRTGMGDLIISVQALEPLLVYYPTDKEQKRIEKIVDEILKRKKSNKDTKELEKEIDVLVYKFYELTYEEVKIIDSEFWMSEEEYSNFK